MVLPRLSPPDRASHLGVSVATYRHEPPTRRQVDVALGLAGGEVEEEEAGAAWPLTADHAPAQLSDALLTGCFALQCPPAPGCELR